MSKPHYPFYQRLVQVLLYLLSIALFALAILALAGPAWYIGFISSVFGIVCMTTALNLHKPARADKDDDDTSDSVSSD